jgi:hypothetical protein
MAAITAPCGCTVEGRIIHSAGCSVIGHGVPGRDQLPGRVFRSHYRTLTAARKRAAKETAR